MSVKKTKTEYLRGYEAGYQVGKRERLSIEAERECARLENLVRQMMRQLHDAWLDADLYKRLYDNLLEDNYVLMANKQILRRRIIAEREEQAEVIPKPMVSVEL